MHIRITEIQLRNVVEKPSGLSHIRTDPDESAGSSASASHSQRSGALGGQGAAAAFRAQLNRREVARLSLLGHGKGQKPLSFRDAPHTCRI